MTDVIGEGFDGAIRVAVHPGASLAVRSFIVHEGESWRSRDRIGNDKRSARMNIGYSVSCSCHRNQTAQPLTSSFVPL